MTDLRQAAQQALEALETNQYTVAELAPHKAVMKFNDAITALREALAQPTQWPISAHAAMRDARLNVGWGSEQGDKHEAVISAWSLREVYFDEDGEPLMHRSPPAAQRPWQGLTDEDWVEIGSRKNTVLDTFACGAAWAADQLEERNNG